MEIVMIEILAGNGIETAFKELGIEAKCTYKNSKTTDYEVWEVAEDDLWLMEYTPSWPDRYGWWSYNENKILRIDNPIELTVNNKRMYGGYYEERTDYNNLQEYLEQSGIGADKQTPLYSYIKGLANQNNMTMAELFATYQG